MLFSQPFANLYRAIERVRAQLATATSEQRPYLLEELLALRNAGGQFLEEWLQFDSAVQALLDEYAAQNRAAGEWNVAAEPDHWLNAADVWRAEQEQIGFRKGLGYFDLSMFRESANEFAQVLAAKPDLALARLLLSLSEIANREFDRAEKNLAILLQSAGDELLVAAAWDAKAQLYAEQGRYVDARGALQHVIALRPDFADAHFNLAVCSYAIRDLPLAVKHAQTAAELEPRDYLAWRLLGAALHAAGKEQFALQAYQTALQIAPEREEIALETAIVLQSLQRSSEAAALYRSLIGERKAVPAAYKGLAVLALQAGQYSAAIACLKKYASLERANPRSLLLFGFALHGQGDDDQARRIFEDLMQIPESSHLATTGLARILARQKRFQEARELLRKLTLDAEPKWRAHGLVELGRLYMLQGDWRQAARLLSGAMAIWQDQPDARILLERLQRKIAAANGGEAFADYPDPPFLDSAVIDTAINVLNTDA